MVAPGQYWRRFRDVHRHAGLLLHRLHHFLGIHLIGQPVLLQHIQDMQDHGADLEIDVIVHGEEDVALAEADHGGLVNVFHFGAHGDHGKEFLDIFRIEAGAAMAHQAAHGPG